MEGCKYKVKVNFINGDYCEYHVETSNILNIVDAAKKHGFDVSEESDIRIILVKKNEMLLDVFKRKNVMKIQSHVKAFSNNWRNITTF